jgi:hypothetical protein
MNHLKFIQFAKYLLRHTTDDREANADVIVKMYVVISVLRKSNNTNITTN